MEKFNVKGLPPIHALRVMRGNFPNAFQAIDAAIRQKGKIPGWDKARCYCPVGLALAYFAHYLGGDYRELPVKDRLDAASLAKALAVLSSWRQTKSVYVVDHSLAEELSAMGDGDVDVYSDMLQIPTYCIYVITDIFEGIHGFYVMFDCDVERKHTELYIVPSDDDWHMGPPIYLELPPEPKKLSDVLRDEENEAIRDGFRNRVPGAVKGGGMLAASFSPFIRFVVNVLLYLSSVNADVRHMAGPRVKRAGVVPGETSLYVVGEETGVRIRSLRRALYAKGSLHGGHHASPVMHIRRAHYHTFLVGKGRKQRKLKWLAPIIVNAKGEAVDFVTVTDVKK